MGAAQSTQGAALGRLGMDSFGRITLLQAPNEALSCGGSSAFRLPVERDQTARRSSAEGMGGQLTLVSEASRKADTSWGGNDQQRGAEGSEKAQGAHGRLGSFALRRENRGSSATPAGAAGTDLGAGTGRGAKTVPTNNRGTVFEHRRQHDRVGGDSDYHKVPERGAREWRQEMLTVPRAVVASSAEGGNRSALAPRAEGRRARPAKSPFRGHPLKERCGITASLADPLVYNGGEYAEI